MRIIGGSARGTQIFAPEGMDTRPTRDQVRESLFNILMADVPGARVLDLFAGSGALALEALSRGAESAVLVDSAREANVAQRRNVEKLRMEDRAALVKADWRVAVGRLAGRKFDLVFLDPPYRIEDTGEICRALADGGLLETGALVVVEHRMGVTPAPGESFAQRDAREYRDTGIHFFVFEGA